MPTVPQPSFQKPGHHPSALNLRFIRFVATVVSSNSMREAERPPQMMNRNPLMFTRHLWLLKRSARNQLSMVRLCNETVTPASSET